MASQTQIPVWQGGPRPPTMPGQFFNFFIGTTRVAAGMGAEFDETFSGSFEQPFGQDELVRQPGMRAGRGHINRFTVWQNDLRTVIATDPAGYLSGVQDKSNVDFRFIELTATSTYLDGTDANARKMTHTLHGVFVTNLGRRVEDGTRNIREDVTFDYRYETVQVG